jgi:hypothetical protein
MADEATPLSNPDARARYERIAAVRWVLIAFCAYLLCAHLPFGNLTSLALLAPLLIIAVILGRPRLWRFHLWQPAPRHEPSAGVPRAQRADR